MNLLGKNVVIYGAGISGLSAYELVKEKGGRAVIYDDDPSAAHATSSTAVFDGADIIILSPGVESGKDFLLDARLENKLVLSELELASSFCAAEQIAVTGTNGKTTATMLIDAVLRSAGHKSHAVGNIGAAFSAIADKLDATEIAVIEASSFQLEGSPRFAPDTAVLLNIEPDHLERHKTMERYIRAKANIFRNQSEADYVIYNADDKNIEKLIPEMKAERIPFSLSRPVDGAYVSSGFICFKGKPVVEVGELDMKGRELENALAATAVALVHRVAPYTLASGLINFKRPRFRRSLSAVIDGINIFNDSKATNVSAAKAAAGSMDGDTVMIIGGCKREENFHDLFNFLSENRQIKAVVAAGENSSEILSSARGSEYSEITVCDNIEDALTEAFSIAKETGCLNILFSPASKSFDRFASYSERGKFFDDAVQKLRK